MKPTLIILLCVVIIALTFLLFRNSLTDVSRDVLQNDLNPVLVNQLQGDWMMVNDTNTIYRIKRDSLIILKSSNAVRADNLFYEFHDRAADFVKKDSSFSFGNNNGFKLREVGPSTVATVYTLINVSRGGLQMSSGKDTLIFTRLLSPAHF